MSLCSFLYTVFFSCEHHLLVHGYFEVYGKKHFGILRGHSCYFLQFISIFHFMFLWFLRSSATLVTSGRTLLNCSLKETVQGIFQWLPMPQGLFEQEVTAWRYGNIKVCILYGISWGCGIPTFPKNAAKCLPEGMWTIYFYTKFLCSHVPVIFHTWITCWQVIFSFGTCLSHVWNRQILCQITQLDLLCSFMSFLKSIFPLEESNWWELLFVSQASEARLFKTLLLWEPRLLNSQEKILFVFRSQFLCSNVTCLF